MYKPLLPASRLIVFVATVRSVSAPDAHAAQPSQYMLRKQLCRHCCYVSPAFCGKLEKCFSFVFDYLSHSFISHCWLLKWYVFFVITLILAPVVMAILLRTHFTITIVGPTHS